MVAEQVIDAAVTALQEWLKEEVDEIRHVAREWPNPSYRLDTPAVSLLTGDHQVTLSRNYEMAREELVGTNKAKVLWLAGYVDFPIQLDIWTDNKEERLDLASRITAALNPELGRTSGLTLALEDFHESLCRYEINSTAIQDSEDSAQRSEWRFRMELRCHTDLLVQKTEDLARYIELIPDVSEVQSIVGDRFAPLDINISPRGRAGCLDLEDGAQELTLNFPASVGKDHYSIRATLVNLVDADPQYMPTVVTRKGRDSFDVRWPAPLDSANYKLDYNLSTIENPHPSIRSRVAAIGLGEKFKQAYFNDWAGPLDSTDYAVACMMSNTTDEDPQVLPIICVEKQRDYFVAAWPFPTINPNNKLDFIVREHNGPSILDQRHWRSGTVDLPAGSKSIEVTFDEAFPNDNYAITGMLFNDTDEDPIIVTAIPIAKSKTKATLAWTAQTDSASYKLDYLAIQKEGVDT